MSYTASLASRNIWLWTNKPHIYQKSLVGLNLTAITFSCFFFLFVFFLSEVWAFLFNPMNSEPFQNVSFSGAGPYCKLCHCRQKYPWFLASPSFGLSASGSSSPRRERWWSDEKRTGYVMKSWCKRAKGKLFNCQNSNVIIASHQLKLGSLTKHHK